MVEETTQDPSPDETDKSTEVESYSDPTADSTTGDPPPEGGGTGGGSTVGDPPPEGGGTGGGL